jgi:hypothetical protein
MGNIVVLLHSDFLGFEQRIPENIIIFFYCYILKFQGSFYLWKINNKN